MQGVTGVLENAITIEKCTLNIVVTSANTFMTKAGTATK